MTDDVEGHEELDEELASLLDIERFDPPAAFSEHALLNDPSIYERAARDPEAWWAEQAEELHWFRRGTACSTTPIHPCTSGSRAAR